MAGARDPQRGTKAAHELGATFISLDPTDDDSVEAAAVWVRNEYGHPDVLINNAGTAAPRVSAQELTADAAMEGFAINVFSPIRVMHAFLPLLRAAERPRIVNVSSGAGSAADPGFTGTDFNNHRGTQTVAEGTDAIVHLATLRRTGRPAPSRTGTAWSPGRSGTEPTSDAVAQLDTWPSTTAAALRIDRSELEHQNRR